MPSIKRYSNRKLYDTETKRYVTLEDIANAIRQGEDVRVVDHVTGEDLTSITLLQVIFEEQKKIGSLVPQVFLSRLIRAGGERMSLIRSRLLSMDPLQTVDEEIRRRVVLLVNCGKLGEEEGQRIVDLLTSDYAQADVIRIPVRGEDEVEPAAAEGSGDNAESEVDALTQQVQALEEELERLKQSRSASAA